MKFSIRLLAAAAALSPATVRAQADANAVTHAGDGFGYRRGDESVGIYDESSVRGFSLQAAGNYRLNGTYFVKNSGVSNIFIESSTVRIGYNTLATILPGPSGIVDYRLRNPSPGEKSLATLTLDAYGQPRAELNLRHGAQDGSHSYSVGISRNFDTRDSQGGRGGEELLVAGIGRWSRGAVTGQLLAGEYQYRRRGEFRVVPEASSLPAKIRRGHYLGQDWAYEAGQRRLAGLIVDADLGNDIGIGSTLAIGQEDPTRAFLQFFSDIEPDGTADAKLVAVPQQRSTAVSAEFRGNIERRWGALLSRLDLSVRLRTSKARFGGSQTLELGRAPFGEAPRQIERPDLEDRTADRRTSVDQWGVGLAYRGQLAGGAAVNLGILKSRYAKKLDSPDGPHRSKSEPWLYNVGVTVPIRRGLAMYGSYARGLEEAGVAPGNATNRNQVLEAIIVTQREVGLRWALDDSLVAILAGFDTRKPYAGLNEVTGAYEFLGAVRHRGLEGSLTGKVAAGVQIVVGGVWLAPRLSKETPGASAVSLRPVGVSSVRATAGVDAEVPGVRGLSVDATLTHVGRRPVRSSPSLDGSQLRTRSMTTLDLGARYGFRMARHDLVLRVQVLNVANAYAWDVDASETLAYNEPRRARILLTAQF